MVDDQRDQRADGAVAIVRRAPFSDNPRVGTRGQRTQQRILDAALQVFGDEGYHRCSVDKIARFSGCSRVSFYQYFASKEDVFRQLGEQVARQLERVDRGDGLAHRRRRGMACHARLDRALPRDLRALRADLQRVPGGARERRVLRLVRGGHAWTGHRAVPLEARDDEAAATPARPRHQAAARDDEPHVRRDRHPALGRARRLPERAGRGGAHRRAPSHPVRPRRRSERARVRRAAARRAGHSAPTCASCSTAVRRPRPCPGRARSTHCWRRHTTSSWSAATTTPASTISPPPPACHTAPSTATSAARISSRAS